jgi:hypothetical protein
MKAFFVLMVIFILGSCSTSKKNPNWDSGAQRQEAFEDETRNDQQDQFRNQFPGQWAY